MEFLAVWSHAAFSALPCFNIGENTGRDRKFLSVYVKRYTRAKEIHACNSKTERHPSRHHGVNFYAEPNLQIYTRRKFSGRRLALEVG